MNELKIEVSDGVIWFKESAIMDMIRTSQLGPVVFNFVAEGPCCDTLGLNHLIDSMVDKFGFDRNLYTIQTSNQLSSSNYKEIRMPFVELEHVQHRANQMLLTDSTLAYRFGFFVSRSNWLRLAIGSYLWKNYRNQSLMTFHYDPNFLYHTENFGLEDFLNKNWSEVDQVLDFLKHTPLKFEEQTYPIMWNDKALDLDWAYNEIFCDVICETFFSGKTFMMTEKTMRAIINMKPFIVQGPKCYLKNLHRLGFKTFDQWWDEGYDNDPWDFKYHALKHTIDTIASQPQQVIRQWYNEMMPTLTHNRNVLLSLTNQHILDTEFYHAE